MVYRGVVAVIAVVSMLSCGGDDDPTGPGGAIDATWFTDASDYRDNVGSDYQFRCPAGGTAYEVWGTDIYTDDSSVCTAAVHAGKITFAQGGTVTIEMLPGQSSYTASTRNGVTSGDWDTWLGSFRFP
jgi:hypothetical protein